MKKFIAGLLLLVSSAAMGAATASSTTSAITVTSSSVEYSATAPRQLIAISNESTTATIACRFGGTAAINTAGSWTIPAGATRVWSSPPIPSDSFKCISSAATSPATLEVY